MVAKMSYGSSVYGLLKYNETKVAEGKALVLSTQSLGFSEENLTFKNKWKAFKLRQQLNSRVQKNAYHFTLNFHPEDIPKLSEGTKNRIVKNYLTSLGLERQPAIIYEHFDAAHPHFHIVTTNIDEDGKRINIFRKVKHYSEKARKQIEQDYDLIKAEGRNQELEKKPVDLPSGRARYGKNLTKETLSKVIHHVRQNECYTNIEEFNNSLYHYGVLVDQGPEGSPQRKNGGLVYGFANENGIQVGRGIKASRFYGKPTLKNLENEFRKNLNVKKKHFNEVAQGINSVAKQYINIDRNDFTKKLGERGIFAHINYDQTGNTRQIHYKHTSGAQYTSDDFRIDKQKLFSKISNYTYSFKEAKLVSKIVFRRYQKDFRNSKIDYESEFLKSFNLKQFIDRIKNENPDIDSIKVIQATQNYLKYKKKNFTKILSKDRDKLKAKTTSAIRFVARNPKLSLSQKILFLSKMGIHTRDGTGRTLFKDRKYKSIAFAVQQTVPSTFKSSEKESFKPMETKEFNPYQKRFFSRLMNEKSRLELNEKFLVSVHQSEIKPFISQPQITILEQRLSRMFQEQVRDNLINGNIKSVSDIMDNGLIVKPVRNKERQLRYVAYYFKNSPKTAIPLSKDIAAVLDKAGFNEKNYEELLWERTNHKGFSSKYKITVGLNRILYNEEYRQISGLFKFIEQINPEAAKEISRYTKGRYGNVPLTSKESIDVIQKMKEVVNKDGDFEKPNPKGKNLLPGSKQSLSEGGLSGQKEKESDQEKLARRLRKKWQRDLDQDFEI